MLKPPFIEDALWRAERDCWFEERGPRDIQLATERINSIKEAINVGEKYEPDF